MRIPQRIPHNKGRGKYADFLNGKSVECIHHGKHRNWIVRTDGNKNQINCAVCRKIQQTRYSEKLDIKLRIIFLSAQRHALQLNREFKINHKDVINLFNVQNKKCALTGIKFDGRNFIPSLDRIDSSKGYINGNIQLILKELNSMKSNMELEKFLNLCNLVSKYKRK